MNDKMAAGSLLSHQGMGPIHGGAGYNFQDAFIASRIPEWIAEPSFRAVLKEGLEDADVLFDSGSSRRFDCYQVKNHNVARAEFSEIVTKFIEKATVLEGESNRFTLACRSLSSEAERLRRGLERLRGARPVYQDGSAVAELTAQDVKAIAQGMGFSDSDFEFLLESFLVDTELGDMRSDERLSDQFVGSIVRRVARWESVGGVRLAAGYRDVARLVNNSIGAITRQKLEETIERAIDSFPERTHKGIMVRLFHWEDPTFDLAQPWDILLDWSNHFNRGSRTVPDSSVWRDIVIPSLEEAQKQVRLSTDSRLIHFRPSACLSAGIALGWAFSEVKGYTFEIEQGNAIWRTDGTPTSDRTLTTVEPTLLDGSSNELCVEFSEQADVGPKVDQYITTSGKVFKARITLIPDTGIGARLDSSTALAYAQDAKQKIRRAVDQHRCDLIHLFYAGPLGLAICIGRLLNAMHADVQCYEEQEHGYAPTAMLKAK